MRVQIPTLAALAYHKSTGRRPAPPNQRLDYSENFLAMLDGGANPNYRPHPKLARALVCTGIMYGAGDEHMMRVCAYAGTGHTCMLHASMWMILSKINSNGMLSRHLPCMRVTR